MKNDAREKVQEITKRFQVETVAHYKQVKKQAQKSKGAAKHKVPRKKQTVPENVTIIAAADFDQMVQEVFQFPPKQEYSVRLDLWSALQSHLDHAFLIPPSGFITTPAIIKDFEQSGRRIGRVRALLDHFVREKLLEPGAYVIRFQPDDKNPRV
jgi:hypothetical protein